MAHFSEQMVLDGGKIVRHILVWLVLFNSFLTTLYVRPNLTARWHFWKMSTVCCGPWSMEAEIRPHYTPWLEERAAQVFLAALFRCAHDIRPSFAQPRPRFLWITWIQETKKFRINRSHSTFVVHLYGLMLIDSCESNPKSTQTTPYIDATHSSLGACFISQSHHCLIHCLHNTSWWTHAHHRKRHKQQKGRKETLTYLYRNNQMAATKTRKSGHFIDQVSKT